MPNTSDRQNRIARWLFAIGSLSCLSLFLFPTTHPQGTTELDVTVADDAIELPGLEPAHLEDSVAPRAGHALRAARPTATRYDPYDPALADLAKGTGEGARVQAFLELARRDPEGFRHELATLMADDETPTSEKIAALRASFASGLDRSHEHFRVCLTKPADSKLRRLDVRFLVDAASSDRQSRDLLAEFVRRRPHHLGQRSAALFAILEHGTNPEVARCLPFVYSERDPGVVAGAALALAANRHPSSRAALEDLRATHPLAEARRRLAKLHDAGWRVDETEGR